MNAIERFLARLIDVDSWELWNQLSALKGVFPLLGLIGGGLLVVIGLHVVWATMRACVVEPSREAVRLVCARLAEALRAGQPAAPALIGLRPLLPWPHPGRLGRAARELEDAAPPTLVAALLENRLLPASLASLATAAERLGPLVLEGWLRSLGAEPRLRGSAFQRLAPPLLTLTGMAFILSFIAVFIAPKWQAIGRELGFDVPLMDRLSSIGGNGLVIAVAAAVPLAVGVALWARWRWLFARRLMRGETIVQAVQAGVPEDAIAAALSLPRPEGSLAALCRSAGWATNDADALALALAATRRRRERAAAVAMSVLEVAAPIVLALPVLALGRGVFGALLTLVQTIAENG